MPVIDGYATISPYRTPLVVDTSQTHDDDQITPRATNVQKNIRVDPAKESKDVNKKFVLIEKDSDAENGATNVNDLASYTVRVAYAGTLPVPEDKKARFKGITRDRGYGT